MLIKLKIVDILLISAVAVVAILTLVLKLAQINNANDTPSSSAGADNNNISAVKPLIVAHFWEGDEAQITFEKIAAEFFNTHPNTPVKFRVYPRAELHELLIFPQSEETTDQAMQSRLLELAEADIVAYDSRWISEMTAAGALASMPGGFIQEDGEHDRWGVPLTADFDVLFYNIEVLLSTGFERPPKNRKEFETYARQLTSPGKYGGTFSLAQDMPPEIYPWIWAVNARMVERFETGALPNFNQKAVVETLEFIDRLNKDGLIAPNVSSKTKQRKFDEFTSGKAAMMIAAVEDIESIRRKMGGTGFGISTIPHNDDFSGGRPVFGIRNVYVGVRNESERKDEAWDFISFLSGYTPAIASAVHALPGNGNTPSLSNDDLYTKAYDMYESSEQVREFTGLPNVGALDAAVRDSLTALFENGQLPQETARVIQERWKEIF